MGNNIKIHMGAMCDPVWRQLKAQGFDVTSEQVSHYQRAIDGIVQLRVLGCLTDTQINSIAKKLIKKIGNHVSSKLIPKS